MLGPLSREFLSKVGENEIHCTLEIWSSWMRDSVVRVRCQFIDTNWYFHNCLVGFENLPGTTIYVKLRSMTERLEIQLKTVYCICADNALNITAALNMDPWPFDLVRASDLDSSETIWTLLHNGRG